MVTKKQVILITLIALIFVVSSVNAETLTGTLESDAGWLTQNYGPTGAFGFGATPEFRVVNIELTSNAKSLVHFDTNTYITSYDSGAPAGAQTPMNLTSGTQVVATGTLGYQRLYDGAWPIPTEIAGYQYYQFDTWNITGLTGTKTLTVNYDHNAVYNMTYTTIAYPSLSGPPTSYAFLYSPSGQIGPIAGNLTFNRDQPFKNDYYATKPAGIGIQGSVVKTVGGTNYPSRAYIVDGITSSPITSQSLVTASDFNFSVSGETIKICVLNSAGDWFNTSTLFSVTTTPTPTPTPSATPTPAPTIAPGYIRTSVLVWDDNGNRIHGANINIYDIEGTTWSNSTSDEDGIHYIDTLPYHTLNIYGTYTAIASQYYPAQMLAVETGFYGEYYYLTMLPYAESPGTGNTNLYVTAIENINHVPVPSARVDISWVGNPTLTAYTNSAGTQVFTLPNNTVVKVTVTKEGWLGNVVSINTGPDETESVSIGIDRAYVTPTVTRTPLPGETTVRPTLRPGENPDGTKQPGYANAQGQEMLNYLATNGMTLVELCFMVTVLALLGIKLGK